MQNSRIYDTLITYDDLRNYYETEHLLIQQSQLKKPDLGKLLQDYLRTIYIYRTRVGNAIYWRLPMYKRPVNPETGEVIEVPPD